MERDAPEPTVGFFHRPWLRRADQVTVGVLVASCFVAILCHWTWHVIAGDSLIVLDQAPPLQRDFSVNVNDADWPELTLLPRIGETLARRIVDYRQQHGPFESVEQLEGVKGIGPKTLRKIRDMVRVE